MRRAAVKTGLCKRFSAKPVYAAHVFARFGSDSGVGRQAVASVIALLCSVCAKVGGGAPPPPPGFYYGGPQPPHYYYLGYGAKKI